MDNVSPIREDDIDWELDEMIQQTPPVQTKQVVSSGCNEDTLGCCSKQLTQECEQHTPDTMSTSTPGSIQKSVKVMQPTLTPVRTMRLPSPCPLPNNITDDIESALKDDNKLLGVKRMVKRPCFTGGFVVVRLMMST